MNAFSARLRTPIVLMALAAVAPAIVAIGFSQVEERRQERERGLADSLRLARLAAGQMAGVLEGAQGLLATLGDFPPLLADDARACSDVLSRILRNHHEYFNLGVADANGSIFCAGAPVDPSVPPPGGVSWFGRALQTRKTTVGGYQLSATTTKPALTLAFPLRRDGPARIAAASIDLDRFQAIAAGLGLPPGTTLTVFDSHRTILARVPDGPSWIGRTISDAAPFERLSHGVSEDVSEDTGVDGVRRLYVTVPIQASFDTGMFLGLGIEDSVAFAEADRQMRRYLWLLVLMSLAVVAGALAAGEFFVVRPMRTLSTVTGRLAEGDLGARTQLAAAAPGLSDIGSAIDAMAQALEERQAQLQSSRERHRLLAAIVEDSEDAIIGKTLDGTIVSWNAGAEKLYGYTAAEAIGQSVSILVPDERADELPNLLRRLAAGEHLKQYQSERRRRDGSLIPVSLTLSPIRDADGRVAGASAIARDISERTRAEQALRTSEERFRRIAETVSEAFWMADLDSQTIVYISPGYERIWGRTCESLYENPRSFLAAVHPDDRARVLEDLRIQQTGQPFEHEYRIVRPDGQVRWIWDRGYPVPNPGGQIVQYVGSAQDITERVRTARALADAEERMRFALEASHVGIWEADFRRGVTFWSETCERMHGLAPGGFDGTDAQFLEAVHPEDRSAIQQTIERARATGVAAELEYRTKWPDGSVHWLISAGRFFYDPSGTPVRGAGVMIDVTERRSLEEQLRQAQKMEAVGQLAGGIAHDFNNMLTAILGNAEFLKDALPPDEPCRADVDEITKAAERAAALTHQLLAFSRKQVLAPRVLHVGDIVSEITPMLRRLLGETIDLRTTMSDRGHVRADSVQLEQVQMNLAVNARDAMAGGGQLTIETADVQLDEAYAQQHPGVTPGAHVMVAVSDTGHGMDRATRERIFEPFFTTKPLGHGTGLGLATVHGIVNQSGGHIWVYSEVGRGTTFKLYLPRTDEAEDEQDRRPVDARSLKGVETILLVEDEEVVREFVFKVLTRQGYVVHASPVPSRAIEFAEAHHGPIHLILTDVVLPGMSGRAMASVLRERHPEAAVLYTSGYTDDAIVHHGVLDPGMSFLQKPFTADAVVRKVREVLDARTGRAGIRSEP